MLQVLCFVSAFGSIAAHGEDASHAHEEMEAAPLMCNCTRGASKYCSPYEDTCNADEVRPFLERN